MIPNSSTRDNTAFLFVQQPTVGRLAYSVLFVSAVLLFFRRFSFAYALVLYVPLLLCTNFIRTARWDRSFGSIWRRDLWFLGWLSSVAGIMALWYFRWSDAPAYRCLVAVAFLAGGFAVSTLAIRISEKATKGVQVSEDSVNSLRARRRRAAWISMLIYLAVISFMGYQYLSISHFSGDSIKTFAAIAIVGIVVLGFWSYRISRRLK